MSTVVRTIGREQFLTDAKGEVEYVVLPVNAYETMVELIEDFGLAEAMKQAENEKSLSREEALSRLENV